MPKHEAANSRSSAQEILSCLAPFLQIPSGFGRVCLKNRAAQMFGALKCVKIVFKLQFSSVLFMFQNSTNINHNSHTVDSRINKVLFYTSQV